MPSIRTTRAKDDKFHPKSIDQLKAEQRAWDEGIQRSTGQSIPASQHHNAGTRQSYITYTVLDEHTRNEKHAQATNKNKGKQR